MTALIKEVQVENEEVIQFPIIPNGLGWKSTEKEKLSVMESGTGHVLFEKIIKAIDRAKEMICLQSFLIQDSDLIDALVRAVKERDVKVYVLGSAEARLKETIAEDKDHIRPKYIALLENKFKNNFIHRVAENFHAKYILIDPTTSPKGFICTGNFTDNGFFHSPELSVELSEKQIDEFFKTFVYHFWEFATDEQTDNKEFEKVQPANRFKLAKTTEILLTSPDQNLCSLNNNLLGSIKKAKKSISISTYILDKKQELVKALVDKAKAGVNVTFFCRPLDWLYNEHLKELVKEGINVLMHPLMHGKSLLVDDSVGYIFTANLIENGLVKGFEVGIKLTDDQVKDLKLIHQSWTNTFPLKIQPEAKLNSLSRVFEFNKDGDLVEYEIKEEQKEIEKRINTVSDLKPFFTQNISPANKRTKRTKVRLVAKLEKLPPQYKAVGSDSFEVIEHENAKKQKERVVAIRHFFNAENVDELKELAGLKVFAI